MSSLSHLVKPLHPFIVINEEPKSQTNDETNNLITTNPPPRERDERDYPKADIKVITQYYQEAAATTTHEKLNRLNRTANFAIITGSLDGSSESGSTTMIYDISNYNLKEIIAGESFVIFLSHDGVCYLTHEDGFQFGTTTTDTNESEGCNTVAGKTAFPIPFSLVDPVERVVAREECLFSTKSGALILWNRKELLTLDQSNFDNEKMIDFALGDGHAVFLSETGKLYGYGTNTSGQLGQEIVHQKRYSKFEISHITERIVRVYATYNTTLVLTATGAVYSCGDYSYGATGHVATAYDVDYRTILRKIDFPHKVADIFPGLFFCAMKTSLNEYYVFGYNNMSQFGRSSTIEQTIDGPHLLDTFQQENIERISCGGYHSFIVTKDRRLYVAGWDLGYACFPSNESSYHYIDLEVGILGRKTPLPSHVDLFASTGLHYAVIYSKSNNVNRLKRVTRFVMLLSDLTTTLKCCCWITV